MQDNVHFSEFSLKFHLIHFWHVPKLIQYLYLRSFGTQFQISGTFLTLFFWSINFPSKVFKLYFTFWICKIQLNFYVRIYLVSPYWQRFISTVCYFFKFHLFGRISKNLSPLGVFSGTATCNWGRTMVRAICRAICG